MKPSRAKSASLPGCGKNEMSGGLPPSTWVLMLASQSASPVYSMLMPTVSPHAPRVSLMEAIDGSSRSGPVRVTVAPPKSSGVPASPSPSPSPSAGASVVSESLSEPSSSSLPQAAATSDKATGTAASFSQRFLIGSSPCDGCVAETYRQCKRFHTDGVSVKTSVKFVLLQTRPRPVGRWWNAPPVRPATARSRSGDLATRSPS